MENEMRERPAADDTTEAPTKPRAGNGRTPDGYYEDDATGYEVYSPVEDEDEDEGENDENEA